VTWQKHCLQAVQTTEQWSGLFQRQHSTTSKSMCNLGNCSQLFTTWELLLAIVHNFSSVATSATRNFFRELLKHVQLENVRQGRFELEFCMMGRCGHGPLPGKSPCTVRIKASQCNSRLVLTKTLFLYLWFSSSSSDSSNFFYPLYSSVSILASLSSRAPGP